ncbi:hypothetical protein BC937DRAFT_93007 [Endogone sp. FLAS-F59071]|nr:hypothetical protein BC937DRAFT_93007 [Endogone sp. FLAS-F59071]|eukprot:RUS23052.1 hypothetical protein BC937DRAFT_93007 [Endogone sp. FLAS-F59071]
MLYIAIFLIFLGLAVNRVSGSQRRPHRAIFTDCLVLPERGSHPRQTKEIDKSYSDGKRDRKCLDNDADIWFQGEWAIVVSRPEWAKVILRSDVFPKSQDSAFTVRSRPEATMELLKQLDNNNGEPIQMKDTMKWRSTFCQLYHPCTFFILEPASLLTPSARSHSRTTSMPCATASRVSTARRGSLSYKGSAMFGLVVGPRALPVPAAKAVDGQMKEINKLFDYIVGAKRRKICEGRYHNTDMNTLIVSAGQETTQVALSLAIYYLAIHPDMQQRAYGEVEQG